MNCWYRIRVPKNVFTEAFAPNIYKRPHVHIAKLNLGLISQEMNEWVSQFDMTWGGSMIFYRPTTASSRVHVDLVDANAKQCSAVNFELTGSADMFFYEDPDGTAELKDTPAGTPYLGYGDNLPVIDRVGLGGEPTLVRTDVPHSVTPTTAPRLLISLRFLYQGRPPSWAETISKLEPFLEPRT